MEVHLVVEMLTAVTSDATECVGIGETTILHECHTAHSRGHLTWDGVPVLKLEKLCHLNVPHPLVVGDDSCSLCQKSGQR